MNNVVLILVGAFCLISTVPLAAQEVGSHPAAERGRRSIALAAFNTGQIGYWARQSERLDLGLELGVNGLLNDSFSNLTVSATPAIKRYLASTGPLAPYAYYGIPLSHGRRESENTGVPDTVEHIFEVGGVAGFGLEWLPIRQVSIGGHLGLRGQYFHRTQEGHMFQIGTLSSGLRAHLYF